MQRRLSKPSVQTQRNVRDPKAEALNRLEENFRTFIQPHLQGDSEDYELIWGWQKFVYDKGQRIKASDE